MSALLSVPPRVALAVSTSGSDSVMVTDWVCEAGLRSQVHSNFLAHLELNVLAVQPLEPWRFDADGICAGNQVGSVILAGLIRGQGSRQTSLRVYDGHRGARDDCASFGPSRFQEFDRNCPAQTARERKTTYPESHRART